MARLRDTAAETRKRGVRGGGRLEQLAAELGRSVPAVRSMASRIGAASFPIDPPTTRHPVTGAAVLDRVAQALDHKARVEVRTPNLPVPWHGVGVGPLPDRAHERCSYGAGWRGWLGFNAGAVTL